MGMKKAIWSMEDLIDLEYFLERDESEQGESVQAALTKRDREIYLNKIRGLVEEEQDLTPGRIIRSWLEERRKSEERSDPGLKAPLPGEAFADIYRLMGYGFLIVGILTGSGLAFSLLNYRGTEPLNVSVYLAALVLSQCLAILFLIGIRFIRRMRRSPFRGSVIFTLVSALMTRLIVRVKQGALKGLEGSQRGSLEAVRGLIRGKRQVYGSLFYMPVFILSQIFGVGFNVGVLGATLLKVLGSDIAFGWQSTVQFSAQAVFRLVQIIALPWSWIVSVDAAYPSLSQIQGSHMVLKDGIYHLSTQDLVSWWPFLFLAVLTYGLAPRVILLAMGLIFQKRSLSRVDLGHAACARLLHRLTTPLVVTQGRLPPTCGPETGRADAVQTHEVAAPDRGDAMRRRPIVALIPDDIFEACLDGDLENVVFKALGSAVREKLRFGQDVKGDEEILRELGRLQKEGVAPGLLLVQEAWQPPIRENLRFIQDLRTASGDKTMLWVGLIGRPRKGSVFTHATEEDVKVWQKKLKALGDPYLGVERLAANDR
jgi:hypothetical protein